MIASLKPMLDVLAQPNAQYLIPVFQRVYSWNRRQCDQLWNDMMTAVQENRMHFIGTFIYMPEDETTGGVQRIDLIDGQQRLTTITLMLIALRNTLRSAGDDAQASEIDRTYLHAANGEGKLQLSEADAPTLAHLIDGTALPAGIEPSKFLVDNLETFREKMTATDIDLDTVTRALHCLNVVAVELEDEDSPQQVFESLNAKGRPLSTTDLLRNTLLIKYGATEQERLFDIYWSPIDDAFQQFGAEQDIYLDAALHSWIAKAAPGIHAAKRNDLYQAFKDYLMHRNGPSLEEMLQSINQACLAFAANPNSPEAKTHLDWVIDKPQGLISQRKIFGD